MSKAQADQEKPCNCHAANLHERLVEANKALEYSLNKCAIAFDAASQIANKHGNTEARYYWDDAAKEVRKHIEEARALLAEIEMED